METKYIAKQTKIPHSRTILWLQANIMLSAVQNARRILKRVLN